MYSIIIPAYNEQQYLGKTLASVKKAMEQSSLAMEGEIIVVDNNSTDQTPQIAREAGAHVVFEQINQIARARNRGAQAAKGKYLVFLDADTLLTPKLLDKALTLLAEQKCCAGGALVNTDNPLPGWGEKLINGWNKLSASWGMAAGCFIFCLREGFEAVGGFDEKVFASEEIWLSRNLKKWGKKRNLTFCVIQEEKVITSDRKIQQPSKVIFTFLLLLVFPWSIRFRRLCGVWYKQRDKEKPKKESQT